MQLGKYQILKISNYFKTKLVLKAYLLALMAGKDSDVDLLVELICSNEIRFRTIIR